MLQEDNMKPIKSRTWDGEKWMYCMRWTHQLFTGFLDSNKEEIYEGDILCVQDYYYPNKFMCIATWSDDLGAWRGNIIEETEVDGKLKINRTEKFLWECLEYEKLYIRQNVAHCSLDEVAYLRRLIGKIVKSTEGGRKLP